MALEPKLCSIYLYMKFVPAPNSHLLILGYCSMASLLPEWRRTDTCIHHLSAHMVNTKLHIYHLVCNLLSWYIINKHKHDSMKNSSFTLLTRTRLTATFDLAMPTAPSHTLIQNSLCSLSSFWLFFFVFNLTALQWKMANSSYHWIHDLWPLWSSDLLRCGWIWAYKWIEGERAFGYKVVSLWRIRGQMTPPICGLSN